MILPKISIITPSYNQGHYIEETICSVLDQGYPNIEYMIIDGGSKDNTVEIIKKYEKRLSYWVSEKDKGQSDAIIKGYQRCTGEIINWLNSDDYYEPKSLFKVAEAFQDPATNVYCGISRIFGPNAEYYSKGTDLYPGNLAKTVGWARIDQPETFFRKQIWDALNGVNDQFHYVMDKEFWMRYLLHFGMKGIHKTNDLLVHFRHHEQSKTISQTSGFSNEAFNLMHTLAINNNLDQEAAFFKEHANAMSIALGNYPHNPAIMKQVIHYFLFYQMSEAYALNNKKAFDLFKKKVNKAFLSPDDARDFDKLTFRNKLIPMPLKKWWNQRKFS